MAPKGVDLLQKYETPGESAAEIAGPHSA
jgi:hypothetical protein